MSDDPTPKPAEASSEATPAEGAAPEVAESPKAAGEKPAKAPKAKPAAAEDGEKPAKAPKKEKAPALEDKPFGEFINEHFLPGLKQTLAKVGIDDLDLKFEKQPFPIAGFDDGDYWQVIGRGLNEQRQFIILFSKEDIQAPKFFCYADSGAKPSSLESFMIDERKVSLDLLLMYAVQRLNGQKWLVKN